MSCVSVQQQQQQQQDILHTKISPQITDFNSLTVTNACTTRFSKTVPDASSSRFTRTASRGRPRTNHSHTLPSAADFLAKSRSDHNRLEIFTGQITPPAAEQVASEVASEQAYQEYLLPKPSHLAVAGARESSEGLETATVYTAEQPGPANGAREGEKGLAGALRAAQQDITLLSTGRGALSSRYADQGILALHPCVCSVQPRRHGFVELPSCWRHSRREVVQFICAITFLPLMCHAVVFSSAELWKFRIECP
jgi:hypothetical protein